MTRDTLICAANSLRFDQPPRELWRELDARSGEALGRVSQQLLKRLEPALRDNDGEPTRDTNETPDL